MMGESGASGAPHSPPFSPWAGFALVSLPQHLSSHHPLVPVGVSRLEWGFICCSSNCPPPSGQGSSEQPLQSKACCAEERALGGEGRVPGASQAGRPDHQPVASGRAFSWAPCPEAQGGSGQRLSGSALTTPTGHGCARWSHVVPQLASFAPEIIPPLSTPRYLGGWGAGPLSWV